MRSRRILARTGVGLGALALVCAPITAYAADDAPNPATCSNRGCNGQDPQATGCSQTFQARTIRSAPIMSNGEVIGMVELRWSPFCGNNWGRVTSTADPNLKVMVTRADGATMTASGKGTVLWTPMIFGRDLCVSATGWIGTATATTQCA